MPPFVLGQTTTGSNAIEQYFLQLLTGFLKNAAATSPDYTVCDYPEGTKLKSCCTPSGKTYVSVARMLPAMAAWWNSGRAHPVTVDGKQINIHEVLLSIYRTAFDPKHPDYWGEPPSDKPTQRSVEAALVAWPLCMLGEAFLDQLASQQRANINQWLASCTKVPERTNNHAWFTAINQGARIELSHKYKEFTGDEAWMIADLKALDALYKPNNDGWYSDSPDVPVYDYYNFFVFNNFPLYWSQTVGQRYPEWNEKFRSRVREFLTKTPYFFAADGSIPLYGRSLIYRWCVLAPLVAGYQEKLWPHSPGLLRRIVRKHLDWHWNMDCFDASRGKLLETLTPAGSTDIRENYVDNGHPYWCMMAFSMLAIPQSDPFWTAEEEPLPAEKDDFTVRFEGPRMLLSGTKRSGDVRWLLAHPATRREIYHDKYMKFAYSSAFPFNVDQAKDHICPDQMLVFRDPTTGETATRSSTESGTLDDNSVTTKWTTKLGKSTIAVHTTIEIKGAFERRTHRITVDDPSKMDVVEVSYPLGLGKQQPFKTSGEQKWMAIESDGRIIVASILAGYDKVRANEMQNVNVIHPRAAVLELSRTISSPSMIFGSLHFAFTKPVPMEEIQRGLNEMSQP